VGFPADRGLRCASRWRFQTSFEAHYSNAGSDPIGDALAPLPPPELFSRFQEKTRLVYNQRSK